MGTVLSEKGGGKTFAPAPDGSHRCVCIGVYDLGTQTKVYPDGPQEKPAILFIFELVDELMEDGRPFTLSCEFNQSLHESSALRPFLQAWRGRAFTEEELKKFDVANVIAAAGLASVIHKEGKDKLGKNRTYANITGVTRLPKGMAVPEKTHNETHTYSIEDRVIPAWMPKWVAVKVRKSSEYRAGGFRDELAQVEPPPQTTGNGSSSSTGTPPTSFAPVGDDPPF